MRKIDDMLFIKILLVLIIFSMVIYTCMVMDYVSLIKNEIEINCKN